VILWTSREEIPREMSRLAAVNHRLGRERRVIGALRDLAQQRRRGRILPPGPGVYAQLLHGVIEAAQRRINELEVVSTRLERRVQALPEST